MVRNAREFQCMRIPDASKFGSIILFALRYVTGESKMTSSLALTQPLTTSEPPANSERAAKMLLAAWTSGEALRLQSAMAQTEAVSTGRLPSFERERFELLQ